MLHISIICATIDSSELVNRSVDSIQRSCRGVDVVVELILVDQNIDAPIFLSPMNGENFSATIIRSNVKGLSFNRNIGLRKARGDWCMFWDADCLADPDFFVNLLSLIKENPGLEVFFGKIVSIEHGGPILRSWPSSPKKLTRFQVWQLATSVNGVWKRNSLNVPNFDERFGIGARFGSCEDVDFYVRLNRPAYYSPCLRVHHPYQDLTSVDVDKVLSYSYGFGALCRKHVYDYGFVFFILSIIKKIITFILMKISFKDFKLIIKSRFDGFFDFCGDGCK